MKYPNVNLHELVEHPPLGDWEKWGYTKMSTRHQRFHLETVGYLAADIAKMWAAQQLNAHALEQAHADEHVPARKLDFEKISREACDFAQSLYLEFQDRGWFTETPAPSKADPQ